MFPSALISSPKEICCLNASPPQPNAKPLIPSALPSPQISFPKISPKIACQAPKPPNSFKQKPIDLALSPHPNRYTGYIDQKENPAIRRVFAFIEGGMPANIIFSRLCG
jgi:hypothetical protein